MKKKMRDHLWIRLATVGFVFRKILKKLGLSLMDVTLGIAVVLIIALVVSILPTH